MVAGSPNNDLHLSNISSSRLYNVPNVSGKDFNTLFPLEMQLPRSNRFKLKNKNV